MRHTFQTRRPKEFFVPEDHIGGEDPIEEIASHERRIAIWEIGFTRLGWFKRFLTALGFRMTAPFQVVITGPDAGWGLFEQAPQSHRSR